jgi:hypothetical protein
MDGRKLRTFSGKLCAFLPDGSVASWIEGQPGTLRMLGPQGNTRWSRKIDLSHQLNLDRSRTHLLTLAVAPTFYGDHWFRGDSALVLDLDGNITRRFDFIEHIDELEALLPPGLFHRYLAFSQPVSNPYIEIWHANSMYEIPENAYAEKNPAFSAGNYIINSITFPVVFIVDHEMKKVLWGMALSELDATYTHDVQVLPNGHLLFYRNEWDRKLALPIRCCSDLVEYDLDLRAPTWTWEPEPREKFFATVMGGVQVLENGNILYNNGVLGFAQEITRSGQVVWGLGPSGGNHGIFTPIQQVKRYDLSSFLENNRDLGSVPVRAPAASPGPVLWGYVYSQGFSPPLLQSEEVSVRVQGLDAPVFLAQDVLFGAHLPASPRNVEVLSRGRPAARMISPPLEAFPGIYLAGFEWTGK